MKKTLLLGGNHFNFPVKVSLWGTIFTGIIFFINGVINIYRDVAEPIGFILGVVMIPCGIGYMIYGLLSFTTSSKYAPRFTIDEKELLFKQTLKEPPIKVSWNQIKRIHMAPYLLDLSTSESDIIMSYSSNSRISKEIKSAIREMAESKGIEVRGG